MKNLIKAISLTLVAAMGFAFAGCSAKSKAGMTVEDGVLTMATNAYFPPYEYYDGETIVGIDADIAAAVAEKLGLELVIEDVAFDSIIGGVQSGKYDIGCAGMTVTEERLQSVNFTTPYATGIQSIIVREGSDIVDIDTLVESGCMVGVQSGTTGDIYMTDEVGDERMDRYDKGNDAIIALTQGKVDAVVIDNQPALAFVEANEGLVILDTPYTVEDYAMAVNLENTELLEAINQALAELTEDGTIAAIIENYIPSDVE